MLRSVSADIKGVYNSNGELIGISDHNGKISSAHVDGRSLFPHRAIGGPMTNANNSQAGTTFMLVTGVAAPFDGLRVAYTFVGGNGPLIGFQAIVSATDNTGTRDYTDLTAAGFRVAQTPKQSGVTYNSTVTNGTPGWKAVTWGGQSLLNIPDPGSGNTVTVWSDWIAETGVFEAASNSYPLMVRYLYGTASWSYEPQLTGQQTGNLFVTDFPNQIYMSLTRSGDAVNTPSNWSDAGTPGATSGSALLSFEFSTTAKVLSITTIGDSRDAVSAESAATAQYRSFERYLYDALRSLGATPSIVRRGISGAPSNSYQPFGLTEYQLETTSKWVLYTVHTVNDGSLTAGVLTIAKQRAMQVIEKARKAGQRVCLIPTYPSGASGVPTYSGAQMTLLTALAAWCATVADIVINPMTLYGNADGSWAQYSYYNGINYDHMTDAGYAAFAAYVANKLYNA